MADKKETKVKKTVKSKKPAVKPKKAKVEKKVEKKSEPIKEKIKIEPKVEIAEKKEAVKDNRKYLAAVGRRKSSVARVYYYAEGDGKITVNQKDIKSYFPYFELQDTVVAPLELTGKRKTGEVSIKVLGGGKRGQAEAVRLGIARVLLKVDPELRKTLKPAGFLTRDSREKERKKPGLKRARKAPQFSKR